MQVHIEARNAKVVKATKKGNTSFHSLLLNFWTNKHYNVWQCYYNSFVGRDFKGWSQMALFVLDPYLNEGERKVLLSYSKVFEIV